jgi:hypothetical protein
MTYAALEVHLQKAPAAGIEHSLGKSLLHPRRAHKIASRDECNIIGGGHRLANQVTHGELAKQADITIFLLKMHVTLFRAG